MSEHTPNRKQAGRVKVTQRLNASSPTEDKDRRLVRRSHRKARKRSERLRDAVHPTMGATNGYLTNPLSCYSAFPVISPSMYPPYNPPGVPPYMPLAFQYPVLPPILQSAAYERDDHERSSETDEESPPPWPAPYTIEELGSATEDVCSTFIDTILPTLVMEVVCGCIEEIVKSYLKQSKLLMEPPIERRSRKMDPLLTEVQRRSVPLHAVRPPPPPPLHSTKLAAALPRPSTGPAAAKSLTSQPQVREDACTRFAPEGIEITQFDSEAELCRHMAASLMDHMIFVHLLDMAMDYGSGALVRVTCESLLYDMMINELLDRLM